MVNYSISLQLINEALSRARMYGTERPPSAREGRSARMIAIRGRSEQDQQLRRAGNQ